MVGRRVIGTIPAVSIYAPMDRTPDVDHDNVMAAVAFLDGALSALNAGGWKMEHIDGPYGKVHRVTVAVIQAAFPGVNAEEVVNHRVFTGDLVESLTEALKLSAFRP